MEICRCTFTPPVMPRETAREPAQDLLAYARARLAEYTSPSGPTPGLADTLNRAKAGPIIVVNSSQLSDYLGPWGPPGRWQGTVAPSADGRWAIHLLAEVFTDRAKVDALLTHEIWHLLSCGAWQRVHGGPWARLSYRPDWQRLYLARRTWDAANKAYYPPDAEEALATWGGTKLLGRELMLWPDVTDWLSKMVTGHPPG